MDLLGASKIEIYGEGGNGVQRAGALLRDHDLAELPVRAQALAVVAHLLRTRPSYQYSALQNLLVCD